MLKKIVSIIWIMSLSIFFVSCGQSETNPNTNSNNLKKKVIKLSHCHQVDFSSELHMAAWIFQHWVNDHSPTLDVKIYAANALGQERDVYEGMQLGGGASCVVGGTAILDNFNKKIGVLDLPFLWRDYDHVHTVLDGEVGDILENEMEQQGFKILAWMDSWGYRNVVTSNREIKTPEDLSGLKIRTIQTPTYIEALNAMGANATPMAFGEIYTSLQTGVLDGFEHSASIIQASKFYEVSKYIAITKHLFGPVVFVFSKAEWDNLTDEEKRVVSEGAKMARDIERTLATIREEESFEYLIEQGMIIHEIDTSGFRKKSEEIQDKLSAELGATDLLELIRSAK
ncbi:TRAP transporter substrate-binding protein [Candidatus Latescibacterota bacterium]